MGEGRDEEKGMETLPAQGEQRPQSGYRTILRSTAIMGGSSVLTTLLGIVRTKVLALMLGPSGVGLTGIYLSVTNMVAAVTGLGIGESGVRQIARESGVGSDEAVSRTLLCVRRMALLSGMVGCLVLLLLRDPVSRLTFGNADHAGDLALLSVMLLLGAVSAGQVALIQGMRRIGDLAKMSVCGALCGTVCSIPLIYLFGMQGIACFLVAVSVMEILSSWWFSRKIALPSVKVGWRQSFADAGPLLKLGTALMAGWLMLAATPYFLRVMVVRYLGLDATGIYQASTTLSFVYLNIILRAMVTDFYPRLSAVADDNEECASLVNKQIEVGLLLTAPAILAIVTLAPFLLSIFYSSRFGQAAEILRWQILGGMLQVVIGPMGFLFRAKGAGKLLFGTEAFANGSHAALGWLGIILFGLPGIGMGFFFMNVAHLVLVFSLVRRHYAFRFSSENVRIYSIFALALALAFSCLYFLATWIALLMGTAITLAVGIYSFKSLLARASEETPGFLLKIKSCLRTS